MSKAAALHVEDDDVPFRQAVLGELDVVEHAEDSHGIREVQFAVVELGQPVEQDVETFGGCVG